MDKIYYRLVIKNGVGDVINYSRWTINECLDIQRKEGGDIYWDISYDGEHDKMIPGNPPKIKGRISPSALT